MKYYIGILLFILTACNAEKQDNSEQLAAVVKQEYLQWEKISTEIQSRNPDQGMTIYSHYRNGVKLCDEWNALIINLEELDTNRVRRKVQLAEWNLNFNRLERLSQEWWNASYLEDVYSDQLQPLLLQSESRQELDDENVLHKKAESSMIQLELILMGQLELCSYFQWETPTFDSVWSKCATYGLLINEAA